MTPEFYSDGIGNIQFSGGMVRIDFVSLQTTADGKSLAAQPVQRLLMTPEAFLQVMGSMQQFTTKMVEAGRFKKLEQPAAPQA